MFYYAAKEEHIQISQALDFTDGINAFFGGLNERFKTDRMTL